MPEGDTVLRTSQGLHRALAGRMLTRAELRWGELGAKDITGREVIEVAAYGKHLFIRLAAATEIPTMPTVTPERLTLHTHLRMDGSWRIHASGSRPWPSAEDEQVRAVLENREWTAVGILLGMLDLVPTESEHRLINHLGPDIMAGEWEPTGRATAVDRWADSGDRPVGEVMLDQTVVAGIGTFYMAESLFVKRISPWTPADEVDAVPLLNTARKLLLRGAQQPTPNTTGDPRHKQNAFVHARSGRPCRRCGTTIRVAGVGPPPTERPAFYCPVCQPGPTPTDTGRPMEPLGSAPHRFGSQRNVGLGPGRRWPGR
ncbi:MAG: Fpg/Nei family DNA glycosylase [Actinomycetota bacterium]|nr:Fpg/Nei family DNA glycosylase [Actinomycetota bacterium]